MYKLFKLSHTKKIAAGKVYIQQGSTYQKLAYIKKGLIRAYYLKEKGDKIWFTITGFIINVYGHLGYEIAPKWLRGSFLFQIVNTLVHHNLHHSKFKGNYSLYFRVWDRLMKTEHPDYVKYYDRIQESRFGQKKRLPLTFRWFKRL